MYNNIMMYDNVRRLLKNEIRKNGVEFLITIVSEEIENNYDDNGVPIEYSTVTPVIKYKNNIVNLSDFTDYKGVQFQSVSDLVIEMLKELPIINFNGILIDTPNDIEITPISFIIKGVHKYNKSLLSDEAVPYTKNELIEVALPYNSLTKQIRKNDKIESSDISYRVVKEYNIGEVLKGLILEREE